MKKLLFACVISMAAAGSAAADDSAAVVSAPHVDGSAVNAQSQPTRTFALAVNAPTSWLAGYSYGASAYVGMTNHLALRANVAHYKSASSFVGDFASIAAGGDGDEAYHDGSITDGSLGAVYFPRRLWSGPTLEAAAMVRRANTHVSDEFATPEVEDRSTTYVAGRALVGWSWLIRDRAFIALAVGVSAGYETGSKTTQMSSYPASAPMESSVHQGAVAGEAYVRIGWAFAD